MPVHKKSKFMSEISTFLKESDSETAMFAIMDVIKAVKKCLMLWLMNLMSLPISVNYFNVKWRVKNSRNLYYSSMTKCKV